MLMDDTRSLIIDDEFASLIKLKVLLSKYGSCETEMSAKKALQMFTEALNSDEPYTLVTFDINMPDVNGIKLLEEFTQLEEKFHKKHSIKIVISSSGTAENVIHAARKNCDAFIVKPAKREKVDQLLSDLGLSKSS